MRALFKEMISLLDEVERPGARASEDPLYQKLGLVDGAISAVA